MDTHLCFTFEVIPQEHRTPVRARTCAFYCHIGRVSVRKEVCHSSGKEEPWVDDIQGNCLKLSETILLFFLHGDHIYFKQRCNICVAQLLSGTERVYLLQRPLNRPLLHIPSLEAPGRRTDCLGIISTLEGNTEILVCLYGWIQM